MNANTSPLPNPVTKIYVRVESGMVTDVYSDNKNVEVEIIDLDTQDELKDSLMKERDCQIRERIGSDIYVIY